MGTEIVSSPKEINAYSMNPRGEPRGERIDSMSTDSTSSVAIDQFHYIITIQYSGPNSLEVATMSGTVAAKGRTREQLYMWVFDQAISQTGAPPARSSISYFSLEPDNLIEG